MRHADRAQQLVFEELGRFVYRKYQRSAHYLVKLAVRDGRLPKPSDLLCVDCERPAAVYDHRAYHEPVTVDAVCDSCNKKRGYAVLDLERVRIDLSAFWANDDYFKFAGIED